jgi:hypothetical protein
MSALIDDYQRTQYVRTSLPIADTAASLRSFKYTFCGVLVGLTVV